MQRYLLEVGPPTAEGADHGEVGSKRHALEIKIN